VHTCCLNCLGCIGTAGCSLLTIARKGDELGRQHEIWVTIFSFGRRTGVECFTQRFDLRQLLCVHADRRFVNLKCYSEMFDGNRGWIPTPNEILTTRAVDGEVILSISVYNFTPSILPKMALVGSSRGKARIATLNSRNRELAMLRPTRASQVNRSQPPATQSRHHKRRDG
jgi:hypothetical protein